MMRKACLVLSTIIIILLGVGCSNLTYTPAPTPYPVDYIPTIIALTVQAGEEALVTPSPVVYQQDTPTPSPTPTDEIQLATDGPSTTPLSINASPTSSPVPSSSLIQDPNASPTRRPTRTPTLTPTPPIPNAGVQISEPGPMSRVTSPLGLVANLHSIPSGSYHVEIWLEPLQPGGESRLLFREVRKIISSPIDWIYLDPHIPFELSRVSEFGQVRVGVYDQSGRAVSVNSVDLILLSMGPSDISPTGDLSEPIVIREPTRNHLIQGGIAIVSGLAKPSEEVMYAELVTSDGSVVGYTQVFLTPDPNGAYVPFTFEVPYNVASGTWVRLQLKEIGVRIPGVEHLSSVEVYISP
jgi:hypothetical protein